MSLTSEEIFKAKDLSREKLSVPEWGGHVWIRVLTGDEVESFGTQDPSPSRVAVLSVCDGDGVRLFTDADLKKVQKKSAAVLLRILNVALKINGLSKEGSEAIKKN